MIFTKCFNHTVENKEFLELLLTICSFIIAQWGVQIYSLMVFAASRIGNNYPHHWRALSSSMTSL